MFYKIKDKRGGYTLLPEFYKLNKLVLQRYILLYMMKLAIIGHHPFISVSLLSLSLSLISNEKRD